MSFFFTGTRQPFHFSFNWLGIYELQPCRTDCKLKQRTGFRMNFCWWLIQVNFEDRQHYLEIIHALTSSSEPAIKSVGNPS